MAKQEEIGLLLKLKDGVTKGVKKMNAAFKKNMDSMKQSALQFTAVFAGIALGIAKTIKSASALQETSSKFDTVFGENVGKASEAVDELTASYAMSTQEAKFNLSSLQDLLVPMGMNADAATEMSINTTKLAADLGSFNDLPTSQVMADIQSALVGNFETMKKYGVVLNETRTKQEAMNLGLWDGKGMLDAATKAQVAYKLIVQGSAAAVGDMARTSEGYANTLKLTEARTSDLVAKIGENFLPIATKVVGFFGKMADKASLFVEANKDLIVPLAAAVALLTGLSAVIGGIAVALPIIIPMFVALTGPIGIAVLAISGLTAALLYFKNSNSDVAIKVRAVWQTLGTIIDQYATAISLSLKFKFGEARKAYKDLVTLVKDSKQVFKDNVEAEKAAIAESIEAKQGEVIAKQEIKAAAAEADSEMDQEFLDRRAEMEQIAEDARREFEAQKATFDAMTAQQKVDLLIKTLGKEKVAQTAADINKLIADGKYKEAKKKQDEFYQDAFVKMNQDTINKLDAAQKAADKAEVKSSILKERLLQDAKQGTSDFFGNLATIAKAQGKDAFLAYKRFAQAQALIATYESAVKAFNSFAGIPIVGTVLGGIAAGAAVGAGMMRVRQIENTSPPQAATGGHVAQSGNAVIHEGEDIITKKQREGLAAGGSPGTIVLQMDGETMQKWIVRQDEEAENMDRAGVR